MQNGKGTKERNRENTVYFKEQGHSLLLAIKKVQDKRQIGSKPLRIELSQSSFIKVALEFSDKATFDLRALHQSLLVHLYSRGQTSLKHQPNIGIAEGGHRLNNQRAQSKNQKILALDRCTTLYMYAERMLVLYEHQSTSECLLFGRELYTCCL